MWIFNVINIRMVNLNQYLTDRRFPVGGQGRIQDLIRGGGPRS